MATEVLNRSSRPHVAAARRLLLIWRNPNTSRLSRVGELEELADGRFAFRYVAKLDPDFSPLVQFPEPDSLYVSDSLPAFFVNRVMSKQRPSYPEYRAWLGLDGSGEDTPVEVLARTGGGRGTDTFHIVDDLQPRDGHVVSRFLGSGVRHIDGAEERVARLGKGQRLFLRDEPDNPVNQRAILIDAEDGLPSSPCAGLARR
ncbi:MAG: hypothetical protein WKF73_07750 [Nocardioidaceae bacterium]